MNLLEHGRRSLSLYGAHTQLSRAFPWEADGLAPVHRRILYAMYQLQMWSDAKYRKSAVVVGHTLGNFHPHSDAACYESLCQMAWQFSRKKPNLTLRHSANPSVDFQGNLGGVCEPKKAAAIRYTEVRLTKFAEQVFFHPDVFPHVPHVPNYDASTTEPEYLANTLPNLLCNGNIGIAVGRASKWPSFDVNTIHELCCKFAENPSDSFDWVAHGKKLKPVNRYGGRCVSDIPTEFLTSNQDFSLNWECDFEWDGNACYVRGIAPGITLPTSWLRPPKGTHSIADESSEAEGFLICIRCEPEVAKDPQQLAKWKVAVEKALSSRETYQTRVVSSFGERQILNFGLPDLIWSWYDTLDALLETNRAAKLADILAKRDRRIFNVLAVDHFDTIMASRDKDNPREWLLSVLPFEKYGVARSMDSVKAVVATPLSTLLAGEVDPLKAEVARLEAEHATVSGAKHLVLSLVTALKL